MQNIGQHDLPEHYIDDREDRTQTDYPDIADDRPHCFGDYECYSSDECQGCTHRKECEKGERR